MAIEVTCPQCASTLRVDEAVAGKQVRCGQCMTVLRVPEPRTDPPEEPPPAVPVPPLVETPAEPQPEPRHPFPAADWPPPQDEQPATHDEPEPRPVRDDDPERRPRRDDYSDRPRPRRRRRPPPPSSPSPGRVLLWIGILCGGLLLGTCACCGGGYMLLPGEKWHRHESPAGGFAVDMPAPVKRDMAIPGMKPEPNQKVEGTILWKRGEVYLIAYSDILPANLRATTDDALLDEAVADIRSDPELKQLVRNERITVSGFTAREVEYVYNDGGTYVARVIVADRRIYVLVAGGRFVGPGSPNVRRFLDSFEVTDKALAGGVAFKKQEDEKKEEQRRAEEERAQREERSRQEKEAAFEATGAYTGPAVPDPKVLPGLVAHLPFDDADPTFDRVRGESGGTMRGKAGVGRGVRGKALTVLRPGAGMDLDPLLPKLRFGPEQSFTVAGWYRLASDREWRPGGSVFAADSTTDKAVSLYFSPARGNPEADVRSKQAPGVDLSWTVLRPSREVVVVRPDSNWHHFALVREYSRGFEVVTLYLDGKWHKPAVKGFHSDLTGLERAFLGDAPDTAEKPAPKQGWPALLGAIDEFCVYDRALSGWEVRTLTGQEPHDPTRARPTSPADLPGVTLHFGFPAPAGGSGSQAHETVSGKRVGAGGRTGGDGIVGTTAVESPRNEGTYFEAKPRQGWPPGPALSLGEVAPRFGAKADEPFTFVTWVRVDKGNTGPCALVRATGSNYFTVEVSAGRVEVTFNDEPPPKGRLFTAVEPTATVRMVADDVPAGWYHLAVTRSADGTAKLFVNGDEVASTREGELTHPTNGFHDLTLGWRREKENLAVAIDELATFDRVLTRDELYGLAGRKPPKK